MERWLMMIAILLIGYWAKNSSLVIAAGVVLVAMAIPYADTLFPWIRENGISLGVTVITVSILIPIATGELGMADLIDAFKSPLGWFGILCGILVAMLAAKGVALIGSNPLVTIALTLGTILGVVFFRGVAAGPVIAAGIVYWMMTLTSHFFQ